MKGQFFISGIVVIAVILIVSMNYANSAEELRIELGNDLAFDNYKNAYERAVPDNWEFVNHVNRTKIGLCVSNTGATEYINTSIQYVVSEVGSYCTTLRPQTGITVNVDSATPPCWLLIQPSAHTALFDDHRCIEFYVYYGVPASYSTLESAGSPQNGTKFHSESIETSPGTHFLSNYRAKNIFVSETSVDSDGNYTVTYKSNQIDYTGEL